MPLGNHSSPGFPSAPQPANCAPLSCGRIEEPPSEIHRGSLAAQGEDGKGRRVRKMASPQLSEQQTPANHQHAALTALFWTPFYTHRALTSQLLLDWHAGTRRRVPSWWGVCRISWVSGRFWPDSILLC
ncbi:hypothetical protein Vretifemale_19146 [Volvox reticuliferus]|uniref:Uncharacterized protein n=1 Tax=Volvox reticuliferus TaxID=1737510 RepID=A0A8J4D480_9CHLO|nr:hypothetical protein Vretifemale_19146 [Volvox reticuliferus]